MAKSQQSFNKIEKEKKKLKKKEEKRKKKEERKASGESASEFAYVDQYGNLTDTPPDPANKIEVDAESIEIGIPKKEDQDEEKDFSKEGKVSFFDHSKGFGFILALLRKSILCTLARCRMKLPRMTGLPSNWKEDPKA